MKLNHMICPLCCHDFYVDTAYATCDACQCFFYASESKTRSQPIVGTMPTVDARFTFSPAPVYSDHARTT